jgi:hypothetical protein
MLQEILQAVSFLGFLFLDAGVLGCVAGKSCEPSLLVSRRSRPLRGRFMVATGDELGVSRVFCGLGRVGGPCIIVRLYFLGLRGSTDDRDPNF